MRLGKFNLVGTEHGHELLNQYIGCHYTHALDLLAMKVSSPENMALQIQLLL